MSGPEEKEGVEPPSSTLIGQTEAKRNEQETPGNLSIRSDSSKRIPIFFKEHNSENEQETPGNLSMRSDSSKRIPIFFKEHNSEDGQEFASILSMKSDSSKRIPIFFKEHDLVPEAHKSMSEVVTGRQHELESVFLLLEENIITSVKEELKRFKKILSQGYSEDTEGQWKEKEMVEEWRRTIKESCLKATLQFLKTTKQEALADSLQKRTAAAEGQHQLKTNLKRKFGHLFQGIAEAGNASSLNQIYTELYITQGGTGEVNTEHEIRELETASRKPNRPETTVPQEDIFKVSTKTEEPVRTVLTKGVAGIGKTVLTQKFTLDWAEGKNNQDIQLTFPFSFRELNLLKEKKFSLVELIHYCFTETKEAGIHRFEEFQVLIIFDGLDECRLPLDFTKNEILTDATASTSVDVLLTNLITGKLLPSARLWITTRPAAANQIPPQCVDMVTEVRGFTDPQKDQYFRKRFRDEQQADRIMSHIKTSRSLHIMCHIPLFCWITATVLEHVLKTREGGQLPKTLTEMYIHFLVVQTKRKNIKYDGGAETDEPWTPENRKTIESLGKLAFEQLQKGNLIFYESDLTECGIGIDISEASVYSGVFTQIFREERGLYQNKVFSFIHLSVQEFLAALHVHLEYYNSGVNLLSEEKSSSWWFQKSENKSKDLYKSAVDKALQSPNGDLDLFLRFLVGLSLQDNQTLLQGLVTVNKSPTQQGTVQYIKDKLNENNLSPERNINLFYCLSELRDTSLVKEIQQYLSSGCLSTENLSSSQWSALVFLLLTSEQHLDVFDLRKYSPSEETLVKLLPVVKESDKAQLSCCNLTEKSCDTLSKVLSSQSTRLRELDLSHNDLRDSGVMLLCAGLESPLCKLEVLRMEGCLITKTGCAALASALRSNTSHLKELYLDYNHPGDSGAAALSALLDQNSGLETLRMDHGGSQSMKPGLRKYACELILDPNTVSKYLIMSEHHTKLTASRKKQPYPDDPERFDYWKQVLCTEGLTGRCYWEVDWEGHVYVAVTYKGIRRRGEGDESCLGRNDQSWSLSCSEQGFSGLHNNSRASISVPPVKRVGVYLDWSAGTLSFFSVSPGQLVHLTTFQTTFTEPVYPAFRIRMDPPNSSVSLCLM